MIDTPGPLVRIHLHDVTASVILNRADKRNALSRAMLAEIHQALDDLRMQKRCRAVVLGATGPAFCAGMDLAEMSQTADEPDSLLMWEKDARAYQQLVEAMLRFPKPIVAAVNGPALAGGAGLVLASDLAIAADTATFGLPEPRRGLVAGIVAPLLDFRIGGGWSSYLLTTAAPVSALHAQQMGIFHEVVPSDQVWVRADELATQCSASAEEALALTKRVLNETIGDHLMTLLAAGAAASSTARTTEAAQEGLAAFLEKREPKWP